LNKEGVSEGASAIYPLCLVNNYKLILI
jgi:hypothetical protein